MKELVLAMCKSPEGVTAHNQGEGDHFAAAVLCTGITTQPALRLSK